MGKTSVLIIRHGETDWNVQGRWQGQSDIPLNENGIEQAHQLAARLKEWPITALYSSDLKRAAGTAEIIAGSLNLTPTYNRAWRERNGGEFEGLTAKELQGHAEFETRRSDKHWAPPNGESNVQVVARVTDAFDDLVAGHAGEMVAVVTHGGAIITLLSSILGFPHGDRARLWVSGNTGFSIVEVTERGAYLVRLNDSAHVNQD